MDKETFIEIIKEKGFYEEFVEYGFEALDHTGIEDCLLYWDCDQYPPYKEFLYRHTIGYTMLGHGELSSEDALLLVSKKIGYCIYVPEGIIADGTESCRYTCNGFGGLTEDKFRSLVDRRQSTIVDLMYFKSNWYFKVLQKGDSPATPSKEELQKYGTLKNMAVFTSGTYWVTLEEVENANLDSSRLLYVGEILYVSGRFDEETGNRNSSRVAFGDLLKDVGKGSVNWFLTNDILR